MKVERILVWSLLWCVIGVAFSLSVDGFDDLSAKESLLSRLDTEAPSPSPTGAPSPSPTGAPPPSPTGAPSPSPTDAPSTSPRGAPSPSPRGAPPPSPTGAPSRSRAEQLMVPLTLISGAAAKGAVCLDGTPPGYHIDQGSGSGVNSWIIHLEGGGWCNTVEKCVSRKTTELGSSKFMEKQIAFTGILSNNAKKNPDFFNWNRVRLRYCDGASFAGEGLDEANKLSFRGQRIWSAAMEELMDKGMKNAEQALLSGCSAGGLAAILHCDEFRDLFPKTTRVKCLSDAGLFLDAIDVGGGRTLRKMYEGVVSLQGVQKNLPNTCTSQMDPTSCFFPQNLVANIKTPMFLLNAAYDVWQIHETLAPSTADPHNYWKECRNYAKCNASQIEFLQGFRGQMLHAMNVFSKCKKNGLFIISCFAHCYTESQDGWFADNSPVIAKKAIAVSVGNWYFDRTDVKAVDCPYPSNKSCLKNRWG